MYQYVGEAGVEVPTALTDEEDFSLLWRKLAEEAQVRQYLKDDLSRAEAGECVGAVFDAEPPARGQVGCPPDDAPAMTRRFRCTVFWLSPEPLRLAQDELEFRCATQEQPCRVAAIEERIDSSRLEHLNAAAGLLEETEVGELVLETDEPVVLESFYDVQELGRFVLVRGRDVVAGGIVTHPQG